MCRTSAHILHHKDNLRVSFYSIVQPSYVWMIKPFHEFYLPPHRLLPLQILHLFLLIDLERNFLVGLLKNADMNGRIGALTDLLTNHVVVHRVIIGEDNNFLLLWIFLLNSFKRLDLLPLHDGLHTILVISSSFCFLLLQQLCLILLLHQLRKILGRHFFLCSRSSLECFAFNLSGFLVLGWVVLLRRLWSLSFFVREKVTLTCA